MRPGSRGPAPRAAVAPRPPAVRREYAEAEQSEIQETAVLRMYRAKGIHARAYEVGGVMRFERVAEVVPLDAARKAEDR